VNARLLAAIPLAACTTIDPAIQSQAISPAGLSAMNGTFSNVSTYRSKNSLIDNYGRAPSDYIGLWDEGAACRAVSFGSDGNLNVTFMRGTTVLKSDSLLRSGDFSLEDPGILRTSRNRWCRSNFAGSACKDTDTSIFANADGNLVVVVAALSKPASGPLSLSTKGMAIFPRLPTEAQ
jgi:hypothetical protein